MVSSSATTPEAEVAKGGSSSSVTEDVDQSESQRLRVKTKIRRKKMLQSVTEQIDAQNPFAALVQTQAVQFNGTREIDQLNQTSVKVRLSYGSVGIHLRKFVAILTLCRIVHSLERLNYGFEKGHCLCMVPHWKRLRRFIT